MIVFVFFVNFLVRQWKVKEVRQRQKSYSCKYVWVGLLLKTGIVLSVSVCFKDKTEADGTSGFSVSTEHLQ